MNVKPYKKLVQEGNYMAQVEVQLIESDDGWSPCLSLEDAYKLDHVCDALKKGDIKAASQLAQVFTLTPVS